MEVHLGVTSKMLIAEIIRMYDLFDGKTAKKKIRGNKCYRGEKLKMGSSQTFMPNYHQKMSVLKLQQTACVMVPASSMILHLWEWLLTTGVESNGHAMSWPCTLGTDEENINLVQGKVFSLSLSFSLPGI